MTLSDYPPHALIAGPSGTGKTNLIYAWMGALAARYSPAELAFYLLDFKEGVSFARFAPGRRDPSWLPHVRLVGVNVNTDREFGLALLRFLGAELRRPGRRRQAARGDQPGRAARRGPGRARGRGSWRWSTSSRCCSSGRDAVAAEAVDLLEDLARRGRSQGIHLVLASQDVSGIEALWGRPALVAQFSLRIALPRARRVLAETNTAAESLPRYHAVVNADSGATEANRVVRVPAAGDRDRWSELQHRLWRRRPPELPRAPALRRRRDPAARRQPRLPAAHRRPTRSPAPVVLLGETIDVESRSARTVLRRAPGRNLAVLGTRVDEACAVLDTAGPLAGRPVRRRARARFSVACLDPDAARRGRGAARRPARRRRLVRRRTTSDWLLEDAAGRGRRRPGRPTGRTSCCSTRSTRCPAASSRPSSCGPILRQGPERRIHVLGWWRGAALLRDTLGGHGVADRRDRRLGGAGRARQRAGRRSIPGTGAPPGIRGRGGRCTSTARCTAAPR